MKPEVGMYVRTNDGYIAKYDKSKHNCSGKYYGFASTIRDLRWEEYDDDCFLWESELKNIVKASYNIIDLIEVGDYVNGNKVDFTNNNNKLSYEDKCIGFYDGDGDITLFENGIKSVITHERMEQMTYKVGE